MVAKVEDCFLAKEQGITAHKLPWKWNIGANQVVHGVRDGELLNNNFSYAASRSGDFPAWAPPGGYRKGLQQQAPGNTGQQPHPTTNAYMVTDFDQNDSILTSFGSSYLMAHGQAAAMLAPGRAEVNTSAPGLARNPSFESINNTGSCSTPSLCVGSPVTVLPSRPSDPGSKVSSAMLLNNEQLAVGPYAESREPQLSDHSFSTESLSYGGSMEDRDTIVNCVDDFWIPHDMMTDTLLTDFRFDPMLDDTADTGACGNSFVVGELESLVSSNHDNAVRDVVGNHGSTRSNLRGSASTASHTSPAPDFCQSFLVGVEDMENPSASHSTNIANKPSHLAIPAKHSVPAAFTASEQQGRLRWSDQPWLGSSHVPADPFLLYGKQPEKSPVGLAGSTPSSPTTPLDPHLFASSLQCPGSAGSISTSLSHVTALRADELQKRLVGFNVNSNKRSFSTMQMSSQTTGAPETPYASSSTVTKPGSLSLPSRIQSLHPGTNTDKFDAAALSALLYSNTQGNQDIRSYTSRDASVSPPAPKQRRRHGTATDPQSIAARSRREKFADRIRILQGLVPNGERLDTVHMLSQTFEYVRFLQHKVWDLYNGKDSLAEVKCEKWKEFVDTTTGQVFV